MYALYTCVRGYIYKEKEFYFKDYVWEFLKFLKKWIGEK